MDALSGDTETRKALAADVAVNCMLGSTCCCYAKKASLLSSENKRLLRWPLEKLGV